jgi:hypothetical protein
MEMLLCLGCGHFVPGVPGVPDGDVVRPVQTPCPECDGTEFRHQESDTIVRAKD